MEKRIGIEFFQLKEEIQKRSSEQNDQFEEVRRLKGNLKDTKKNIAELLTLISKKK
jgi:ribosomal protein L29